MNSSHIGFRFYRPNNVLRTSVLNTFALELFAWSQRFDFCRVFICSMVRDYSGNVIFADLTVPAVLLGI